MVILRPAIMVGVAPSVLITYGQCLLHAADIARSRLLTGLGFLAVLLFAGLWLGRRFLAAAFVVARHLHYTLIFPIFVALREVLRAAAERLAGRSISPEQLAGRRRLGTILAALLFAIAGLTLALTVELQAGLKLVDVERVRVWATLKA